MVGRFEWRRLWASGVALGMAVVGVLLCAAVFGFTAVRQQQVRHQMTEALTTQERLLTLQLTQWADMRGPAVKATRQRATRLSAQLARQREAIAARANRDFLQARIAVAETTLTPLTPAMQGVPGSVVLQTRTPARLRRQLREDRQRLAAGLGVEQAGATTQTSGFVVGWLGFLAKPVVALGAALLIGSAWLLPHLGHQRDWMALQLATRWQWPLASWASGLALWALLLLGTTAVAWGVATGFGQPLIGGTATWRGAIAGQPSALAQAVTHAEAALGGYALGSLGWTAGIAIWRWRG